MNRREFIAAAAFSLKAPQRPEAMNVVVEAGRFDRRDVVVSVPLPARVGRSMILRDDSGKTTPLQIDGDRASFVLSDLKAGKSKKYLIERSDAAPDMHVKVAADERLLRVMSGADRIFDF